MDTQAFYMSLPYDLSGSRSKNRFRLELLWGVSKILDLLEQEQDFTMVFDHACDIEVHFKDGFEFYQIKTHGKNKNYTCKALTKVEGEGSILGKLYVLNQEDSENTVKLAVVSNIPYKYGKTVDTILERCFSSLPDKEKEEIEKAIQDELKVKKVDLSKIFYINTPMNLENPQNEIMGKLTFSFEKIKQCEPANPNALYRLIYDTVVERASYEYSLEEYSKVIERKGLTRAEFDRMLDCHAKNAKTGIKQTEDYIEGLCNISLKRKYKRALASLIKIIPSSLPLKRIESEIAAYLLQQDEIEDIECALNALTDKFYSLFPPEIDNTERAVFYIIILKRFEEGVYDNENDV